MASQPISCPNCKIRNPASQKKCVNCGYVFATGELPRAPKASPVTQKASDLRFQNQPVIPTTETDGKVIYYPPPKQDTDILPGRPGCLTIYIVWELAGAVLAFVTFPVAREFSNTISFFAQNGFEEFAYIYIGIWLWEIILLV